MKAVYSLFFVIIFYSCSNALFSFSAIKKADIKAFTNEQKKIVGNQTKLTNDMKDVKAGLNDINLGINGNKTGLNDLNDNIVSMNSDINSIIETNLDINNQINGINKSLNQNVSGNGNIINDNKIFEKLFYTLCGFLTLLVGGFFKLLNNNKRVQQLQIIINEQKDRKREWRDKYNKLLGEKNG